MPLYPYSIPSPAVSQPDLAESPNPVGRCSQRTVAAALQRHGTQRSTATTPATTVHQSGGVVAPPGACIRLLHTPSTRRMVLICRHATLGRRRVPQNNPWIMSSAMSRCCSKPARWSSPVCVDLDAGHGPCPLRFPGVLAPSARYPWAQDAAAQKTDRLGDDQYSSGSSTALSWLPSRSLNPPRLVPDGRNGGFVQDGVPVPVFGRQQSPPGPQSG